MTDIITLSMMTPSMMTPSIMTLAEQFVILKNAKLLSAILIEVAALLLKSEKKHFCQLFLYFQHLACFVQSEHSVSHHKGQGDRHSVVVLSPPHKLKVWSLISPNNGTIIDKF